MPNTIETSPNAAYSQWEDRAKKLLVNEMWKRGVSYKTLSQSLERFGIDELPDQINRKVNRKRFSAAFLLACLAAMEVESVAVPGLLPPEKAAPK